MKSNISIHRLFVISTYLTASLATFALGYVEQDQVKGVSAFYALMGLLFLVAFLSEDRWKMTDQMANWAAAPLLGGWLLWVWVTNAGVAKIEEVPQDYLRILIPHGGPLLALLTLAKLLREKNKGDHWWLHVLSLFQIVMACCLAYISRMDRDDPIFGFFFISYILSAIWSLHLFYLQREAAECDGLSRMRSYVLPKSEQFARGATTAPQRPAPVAPWRLLGIPNGIAWFALASLFSLVVFFGFSQANPDGTASLVLPGQTKAQAGFNTSMDLNQNIPLTVTDALVMRVQAHDALGNAMMLGQHQRWRGITCSQYDRGRWSAKPPQDVSALDNVSLHPEGQQLLLTYYVDLSALGPGQQQRATLDDLPRGVTGARPMFLADPIYIPGKARGDNATSRSEWPRVALVNPPNWMQQQLGFRHDEPVLTLRLGRVTGTLRYQQLHFIPDEMDREWSYVTSPYPSALTSLLAIPKGDAGGGRLKAKAEEILTAADVPTGDNLRRSVIDGKRKKPEEIEVRTKQARTLQSYLLNASDFNYALEHKRVDYDLDPTVDFLLNGKQGHCQLFASALALMLRSQGIPSRIVIGFRGSEWLSAGEIHEIRQYHSHAWVEAFIEVPLGPGERGPRGRWLTLDPTPGGGTETIFHETSNDQNAAFQDEIHLARYLWEALILDYSGDLRPDTILGGFLPKIDWATWNATDEAGTPTGAWRGRVWLTVLGVFILGIALLLWLRKRLSAARRAAPAATLSVPFYQRWLRLMARLNLRPQKSQTPAEFGSQASDRLGQQPALAALVQLPPLLVEVFYAIRFGGKSPEAAQVAALERDLDRLEKAL